MPSRVAPVTPAKTVGPTTAPPQSSSPVVTSPTSQKTESSNGRPKPEQTAACELAAPAGFRRFTCTSDGASKFWEVATEGTEVTVHFGRIGTRGQTKQKTFASAAEASREKEKLIREKLGKGYVEQGV
jgi:predicted DNA-binding WGR domain protein